MRRKNIYEKCSYIILVYYFHNMPFSPNGESCICVMWVFNPSHLASGEDPSLLSILVGSRLECHETLLLINRLDIYRSSMTQPKIHDGVGLLKFIEDPNPTNNILSKKGLYWVEISNPINRWVRSRLDDFSNQEANMNHITTIDQCHKLGSFQYYLISYVMI